VCWGDYLNDAATIHYAPPPADAVFEQLSVGESHVCGIVKGGLEIRCWGDNQDGRCDPPAIADVLSAAADDTASW
jgi:hypothetical protein